MPQPVEGQGKARESVLYALRYVFQSPWIPCDPSFWHCLASRIRTLRSFLLHCRSFGTVASTSMFLRFFGIVMCSEVTSVRYTLLDRHCSHIKMMSTQSSECHTATRILPKSHRSSDLQLLLKYEQVCRLSYLPE